MPVFDFINERRYIYLIVASLEYIHVHVHVECCTYCRLTMLLSREGSSREIYKKARIIDINVISHDGLKPDYRDRYEINIGGAGNRQSLIRRPQLSTDRSGYHYSSELDAATFKSVFTQYIVYIHVSSLQLLT